MEIRRVLSVRDQIHIEGGLAASVLVTRVAVCAVVANPLASQAVDDVGALVSYGAQLGEKLSAEALTLLRKPVRSYGKAALVGIAGDIEHGAAIMHPLMGRSMRAVIGGGKALIPSNVKIASAGAQIDVPLGHRDDPWAFDEIDTMTVMVPGAPRPDEVVIIVAMADGGRPRPRVSPVATAI
ncbi:amino acid synthesis family protein [Rhizobium sp. LEGMi135b]